MERAERLARLLKRLQSRRCATTGARLWKTAEVDHRMRCSGSGASTGTRLGRARVLGLPNLQVINRDIHAAKCADEATMHQPDRRTRYQVVNRRASVLGLVSCRLA
jgi:hypothetical protein